MFQVINAIKKTIQIDAKKDVEKLIQFLIHVVPFSNFTCLSRRIEICIFRFQNGNKPGFFVLDSQNPYNYLNKCFIQRVILVAFAESNIL